MHTPSGAVTFAISLTDGHLRVTTWGPGAEWIEDNLELLLGAADRERLELEPPQDEPLRSLWRRYRGLPIAGNQAPVDTLIAIVVTQKVSGKEASLSYRRFAQRFGERAPGPHGLHLPPRPAVISQLGYEDFHPFGIERKRAQTILTVARSTSAIEAAVGAERPAAYRRLMRLPGIGRWSTAKLLFLAKGDPDAVWLDDYNLPSFVSWNLVREARADDRRMLELLEPYRGHRGRIIRLLELGGTHPPRFGPRHRLRRIEAM